MTFKEQSGFRKAHSTDSVLCYVSDVLYKEMDNGRLTGVVFLDLKKAFDTVDHGMLIDALSSYGITDIEKQWFTSYLQDRSQCTAIEKSLSQPRNVQLGIQQGSILGPQLFSLYVNTLPKSVKNGKVMTYADDTMLLYSATSVAEIESRLNEDLLNVNEWLREHRLVLNTAKTKYMIFGTPQKLKNITEPIDINVNQTQLERVYGYKYLGVFLDQYLNWNDHLENGNK